MRCWAESKPAPLSLTASCRPPARGFSQTSTRLAAAWRATLRSASCAMRKRASAASCGTLSGMSSGFASSRIGASPRKTVALGLQRFDQAEVFEDGRVQSIRQRMYVLAQPNQALSHRPHCACGGARRFALFAAGIYRQHRQALGHVVVQLTRKARALLLLRADQPPAQLVRRLLRPDGARHVRGAASADLPAARE